MECADIHLINISHNATIRQFVCNSCNQFFGSLFREGCNEDTFRLNASFLYEIYGTLNERVGLAGSWACCDEDRAFCGRYCPALSFVRICLTSFPVAVLQM